MEECRGHYLATYIDHPGFPMPLRHPAMAGVSIEQLVEEYRRSGRDAALSLRGDASAAPSGSKQQQQRSKAAAAAAAAAAVTAGAGIKKEEGEEGGDAAGAEAMEVDAKEEDAGEGKASEPTTAAGKKHRSGQVPPGGKLEQQLQDEEEAAAEASAAAQQRGTFTLRPAAANDPNIVPCGTVAKTPWGGGEPGTAKVRRRCGARVMPRCWCDTNLRVNLAPPPHACCCPGACCQRGSANGLQHQAQRV